MILTANSATLHLFCTKIYLKKVLLLLALFLLTRPIGPPSQDSTLGDVSKLSETSDDLEESLVLPVGLSGLGPTDESWEAAPCPAYSPITQGFDAVSIDAEEELYPSGSTNEVLQYAASEALPVSPAPARSTDLSPAPISSPEKSSSLNPYWSFFLAMHACLLVQYLALDLEDYIIVALATSSPPVRFRTKANTWNKRRMRLCFYATEFVRLYGVIGLTLLGLFAAIGAAIRYTIEGKHGGMERYPPLVYVVCLEVSKSLRESDIG